MTTLEIIFTVASSIFGGCFIATFVESLATIAIQISNAIEGRKSIVQPNTWLVPAFWFMLFISTILIVLS